jgi:hypothetical protein
MSSRAGTALGILLAVVSMEIVVRQVYHLPVGYEPGFGTIIRPGATVVWSKEGRGVSHWTSHGLRGREVPDLGAGSILILGNSYTEALQVDDDEAYPALVASRLRALGVQTPVLNAGRSGTSAADYAAYAARNRRLFRPRWTVIQLTLADLDAGAWDTEVSHFAYDADGRLVARPRPEAARGRVRAALSPLVNRAMLLVYGQFRLQEFRDAAAAQPPLFRAGSVPAPTVAASPSASAYPVEAEVDLLAGAYEGRVTFLLVPPLDFHDPRVVTSVVEERVEAHCRRAALSCVSLRPGYPALVASGLSPFGFDNSRFNEGHLNERGHRLAADALAAELERLLARGLL